MKHKAKKKKGSGRDNPKATKRDNPKTTPKKKVPVGDKGSIRKSVPAKKGGRGR